MRYQHLYFLRKYGRSAAAEELVVDSALASWAFLSDCKENLYDSILSAEPSWLEMRNIGVGFWFTNTTQLRTKVNKHFHPYPRLHIDKKNEIYVLILFGFL